MLFQQIENQMNSMFLAFRTSPIAALVIFSAIILTGCGGEDGKKITNPLPERSITDQAGNGNLA